MGAKRDPKRRIAAIRSANPAAEINTPDQRSASPPGSGHTPKRSAVAAISGVNVGINVSSSTISGSGRACSRGAAGRATVSSG